MSTTDLSKYDSRKLNAIANAVIFVMAADGREVPPLSVRYDIAAFALDSLEAPATDHGTMTVTV